MKFKISHSTRYSFDSDVFLEPHYFRFLPKESAYLKILNFSFTITPKPTGQRVIKDEDNNDIIICWFENLTNYLNIDVVTSLETIDYNPFSFIVHPQDFNHLPFQYSKEQQKLLFSSLEKNPISSVLFDYGEALIQESNYDTLTYLSKLVKKTHQEFNVEFRELGFPLEPEETYSLKRGSCRDLSWMLINLLRHQGFAARFVSGYFYFDMAQPSYELHAWVEVFIPGTGWLGLDPTHGIYTGNSHFPIASSAHFENTMPVTGSIRGSASSQLITKLSMVKS